MTIELRLVTREFIADAITPITAFLALAKPASTVLLESVEGHDRLSRFSFMGLDYLASHCFDQAPNLLEQVRAFSQSYHILHDTKDLPVLPIYGGGVVAAFSYDAIRSLEQIGAKPGNADEFEQMDFNPVGATAQAAEGRGALPAAYCVVPGTWVVFDHLTHRLALIGLAEAGQQAQVAQRLAEYEQRLLSVRATKPGPIRASGPMSMSMDAPTYLKQVAAAKQLITDGDIYQIQLGIRFSCPTEGQPFDFYRAIRARNPSPYMFYLDAPFGALFGASPEFLVRLDGRAASLRPLAGTRPRGVDAQADREIAASLLANPKERAEHVMLVDLGRNDLGIVAQTGSVHVDQLMQIERYSHVMHIVSNVCAQLRPEVDALDLFAAAFPAGTVTGTPKIRAMQRIDELEPTARGFYAGSIAHLDFNGDMDSCILLRSVHYRDGCAVWQASAGIVADSNPLDEFREILHKSAIVRNVLGCPEPEY